MSAREHWERDGSIFAASEHDGRIMVPVATWDEAERILTDQGFTRLDEVEARRRLGFKNV